MLVVHMPTGISEQRSNPAVAITAILAGQLNHTRHKTLFVRETWGHLSLHGPVLTHDVTGSAL